MSRWFAETVIDDAGAFVCITDREGNIILFNKEAERISGYTREEVLGKSFCSILTQEACIIVKERVKRAFEEEKFSSNPVEFDLVAKDGQILNMEWRSTLLKGEEGEAKGTMEIGIDITDKRRVEEQREQYVRDMAFLARSAMDFVNSDAEENIYQSIADGISSILTNAMVSVNRFDEEEDAARVAAVASVGDNARQAKEKMAESLSKMVIKLDPVAMDALLLAKLVRVPGKLHTVTCGCMDEALCTQIEDEFCMGSIFSMGLVYADRLMGSVAILLFDGGELENASIVETYISQASVALQKRQAEEHLRESERRFRELLENVRLVAVNLDTSGKISFCNDFLLSITGWSREELVGKNWFDTFITEDGVKEIFMEGVTKGAISHHYENHISSRSGEKRLIAWSNIILRDAKGTIIGTSSIGEDITERRKAEEALRRSEERSRILLEAIPDMVFLMDKDGVFLDYNPGKEDPYVPAESFLGRNIREVLPKHVSELTTEAIGRAMETKSMQSFEYEMDMSDGPSSYEARIMALDSNSAISIVRNVTDQKKLERELVESRDLFSDILDSESAGIYRIRVNQKRSWLDTGEPPYRYVFMNDRYCEMTGISREEHRSDPKATLEMIHPDDYDCFVRANEEANRNVTPFYWEGRVVVNGETRWFNFQSNPRVCDDGTILWTGMLLDITDKKQAEADKLENQLKYESLVKNIPGIVYRCANDPDWTMEFISDETENILGYPASDFVANKVRTYTSIIHPDDRNMVNNVIQEAVGKRSPYHLNYRVIAKDSKMIWVGETGCGVFAEDGSLLHLDGVIVDITEKIRLTEESRRHEERYRVLFENAPLGIVTVSPVGDIIDINPAVLSIFGVGLQEALKINVLEFPLFVEAGLSGDVQKCFETGLTATYQRPYTTTRGKRLVLRYTMAPLLDKDGRIAAVQGILGDMKEQ